MIFFFHCHKAGGTTVVESAMSAGFTLSEGHANGNLVEKDGSLTEWDTISDDEAVSRIQAQINAGVDFLAFEFTQPKPAVLDHFPEARRITVLRDPLARMVSNFRMDMTLGYVNPEGIYGLLSYTARTDAVYRSDNYYIRYFCRLDPHEPVHQEHLDYAIRFLQCFDMTSVLETTAFLPDLAAEGLLANHNTAWQNHQVDTPPGDCDNELSKFPVSPDFIAENRYDYALYSYFKHQAMRRARKYFE